jgi:hypothetical protein
VREGATAELVGRGLAAIGPLRQAKHDPDIEIARRAERCLEQIEKVPSSALSAAAARLVAARKPEGAVSVLLAYLPVADDENVTEEVRNALAAVALTGGRPDPLLERTLEDPLPVKRAAAAEALIRSGRPEAIETSRKALADGNLDVRLRTAMALVIHGKDRKAMPDLIGLLGDLPQGSAWRVEDVLVRLAGERAPAIAVGTDGATRIRSRDAWLAWWQENSAKVDLTKLDEQPVTLGLTLVVLRDTRGNPTGQVLEVNAAKEIQWRINNLQYPVDAVVVGKDRVVVFEQQNQMLSERDFSGKVIWSQQTNLPCGVQRLPNGHLFVTCRNELKELDGKQNTVWKYNRGQPDILAAQRLRNGETVFLTNTGACIRLDAKGTQIESIPTNRPTYGDLDVLANGRLLVTQLNSVNEFDATGKSVWSASVTRPSSLQRLPNGNTLVVGQHAGAGGNPVVVELDRGGKPVWEYHSPDGSIPWRARRR